MGREATVDAFYSPSDEVKRIIGQLVDIEETFDYTNLDTFKLLKKVINNDFKINLEKETFE
jgi:tetrahydromethanopterin S-methyltransferase subunit G